MTDDCDYIMNEGYDLVLIEGPTVIKAGQIGVRFILDVVDKKQNSLRGVLPGNEQQTILVKMHFDSLERVTYYNENKYCFKHIQRRYFLKVGELNVRFIAYLRSDSITKLASLDLRVKVVAGPPYKLLVYPETTQAIENNSVPLFKVQFVDCGDNVVTSKENTNVKCELFDVHYEGYLKSRPFATFYTNVAGDNDVLRPLSGQAIELPELINSNVQHKTIVAKFTSTQPNISSVTREIKVFAVRKPSILKLFFKNHHNKSVELKRSFSWPFGQNIRNIHFKIYDSNGEEYDNLITWPISVSISWANSNTFNGFASGCLPDIPMPTEAVSQITHKFEFIFLTSNFRMNDLTFEFQIKLCKLGY